MGRCSGQNYLNFVAILNCTVSLPHFGQKVSLSKKTDIGEEWGMSYDKHDQIFRPTICTVQKMTSTVQGQEKMSHLTHNADFKLYNHNNTTTMHSTPPPAIISLIYFLKVL